ncbi:MAG: Asp-tRNA(Asn)/Glu-tRNA(Gln) amidotransferase subunit GatA [Chloroflexi bacterium]|nr:Asp-tRNA(Asn)/Glu-tRNA(Gln) amidotransferase subunit GatA [Chloroflexota bacterium]
MSAEELVYLSAAEAARRLRARELSPRELVEACLARIEALNPRLNAFVTVTAEAARAAARTAEAEIQHGRYRGPLHGIPLALKDLFATRGVRTAAGSKVLADWVPDYDSAAGERLREAGAILLGKTNTHEFAFGATTINPHFGPTRNPWDTERVPGGSSGGSAAAVAAGLCTISLGSDTGGSIRLPAGVTATVGLKPTYGRVSRYGVVPLSWSQDHVGSITRTVEDAALVLNAIAGHDPRDPASARRPASDFTRALDGHVAGLRLGLLKEQFEQPTDPEVSRAVSAAVATLEGLGAKVEEVSFPEHGQALNAGSVILFAEAASVHETWLRERPGDYGEDVRGRLEQGSLVPAIDYLRAQRARTVVIERFNRLFERVDLILSPSVPVSPPKLDEPMISVSGITLDARAALLRNTRLYDVLGLPALSVPCGFTRAGLPVGLQVAGKAFDEAMVLRLGCALEQVSPWRSRHPSL